MGLEMVKIDLEAVARKVRAALENFPQVAGAYLFGSALGNCRPDSDIDLGLVLEPGTDPESAAGYRLEAEISCLLPPFEGHPFDLFLLNPKKPLFAFKVMKEGKLVYCRNRERVTDVLETVSRRYADLYPRYRSALEEIFAEVVAHGPGP
ncbi:MAG: nucleotidyltransferase domain-containing protein [Desulfotomaculales bacterium]